MSIQQHPTPEQARAALDAASSTRVHSDRDVRTLRTVLVGVGAAWALLLPLIKTAGAGVGLWVGMGVFFAVCGGLIYWQRRSVRSVPRGYGKWYTGGIAAASAAYAVGIAVVDTSTPWITVLLCTALVLLPTLFCASRIGARR